MGSGASMDWWEDELCARLAAGGRLVIRYDHRDTGQSVSSPPGAPDYGFEALLEDPVGVLDAFGVPAAHVVGLSMGGAIAQLVALDHPERVTALTLMATSAGPGDPDLPTMSDAAREAFARPAPDWSDREAVIEHLTQLARASASPRRAFDEDAMRALWARVLDRTRNIESSMTNHDVLPGESRRWRERLGEIGVPTLVIHGDDDPLFALEHGAALAREIPGAELLTLERTGHELPRAMWDVVVPAILAQTR
jgi:pimeloyl-ACP methyl ester carboxylesterase